MLKLMYETMDEVPENLKGAYEEKEGKAAFIGAEGMKSQADIDRVQEALRKERKEHADTKKKLKGLEGIDPDAVQALRDENEELKARVETQAQSGAIDEKKLEELAERNATLKTRPLEREIERLKQENAEHLSKVGEFETREKKRTIIDAVRAATAGDKGIKIIDTALADIEFLAPSIFEVTEEGAVKVKDGVGFLRGASPREWLAEVQGSGTRKHWFPGNVGAGASSPSGGTGGPNPFAAATPNLTEISRLVRTEPTRARALATAANRLDLLVGMPA